MTPHHEDLSPSRRLARRLLGALAMGALALGAGASAGCPGSEPPRPDPDQGSPDAGASEERPDQGAASPDAQGGAAPKGEGITQEEPAPGSLAVKDVGPPAPTVFLLSGLKGYTEPCGCTLDILLGGIDRISGFLTEARTLASGSLVLDAGNTLFDMPKIELHRVAQERAKTDVIVEGLLEMGVASTTPGPNDFALGKHFYLDKVRGAGMEILVANLKESEGLMLGEPHVVHDLDGFKLGVVGLVQPDLFLGIEGLTVSDPIDAARASVAALQKEGVQAILAVHHGDMKSTKALLEAVPEINFAIVGHEPRETDQVDAAGQGFTLEAYDQGRYVGVLKLYARGETPAKGPWVNGRKVSKADMERIDRRIAQIEGQIERMPPATPGKEPAFLKRLRDDLKRLQADKITLSTASIELPEDKAAFIYRSTPMQPGYKLNDKLTKAREAYNLRLKELIPDEEVPPVQEGQAEYVGAEKCATCHPQATAVWQKTAHSHAINTLVERNKEADANCIGCHVTGYREPGGSVLGKLQYSANVGGQAFTKKLENVGCEVCHGPGSLHITGPVNEQGKPQNIRREVPEARCVTCHNSEHSPRFNYPVYIEQVLGEGHNRKTP